MPHDYKEIVNIKFTPEFKRNLRVLVRKYRHIFSDVQPLIKELSEGKIIGDQVPKTQYTIFKLRIKNSDILKGKRSGYRLIYYLKSPTEIVLITIYSKLEQGDVSTDKVRRIVKEFDRHSP